MTYMVYMDLAVCCPEKTIEFTHSLTTSDNKADIVTAVQFQWTTFDILVEIIFSQCIKSQVDEVHCRRQWSLYMRRAPSQVAPHE